MNFLLDTHVVIWLLDVESPLKQSTRDLLSDRTHKLSVSVATIWEISVKKALGRLESPDDLLALLELNQIRIIPVTAEHAFAVRSLPLLHGDPFDRMLVVQALVEDLTIVTHEKQIQAYAVSCRMV